MIRHHQYDMSPSPLYQQQTSPYPQTQTSSPHQTQFVESQDDGSHNDHDYDDDDEDDNEREVLEPEEVSIISMNSSASRNLKRANKLKEAQRREAESQKYEQGSQMDPDDDNDNDRPIKTCEYDHKGRCIRHPNYQLRKKKMFKGWVTLLSNCPECCLDEMKRVKRKYKERVSSPAGGSSIHSNSVISSVKKKKKKKKKQKSSSQLPPITQLNVSNSRGSGADDNSSGTASTFTVASSFTNTSGKWQNYLSSNGSASSAPQPTTARVTRLPYNDQYNENGWYTGQVSMAGIPNGWGMMNYANGHTFEGEWRNGVSVTPAKTREAPPVLGRGGGEGGNFYSHHHHPSHQLHSLPHDPPRSRRQRTHLEPLREDPLSSPFHGQNKSDPRSRIVNTMPYSDNRGTVIGAYTGEVDEYHIPNGIGSMRYNSGLVSEGRWIDGELEEGYDVTEDENGDDDASYRSSARSVPGVRGYRNDGYQQENNNTRSYPRQNDDDASSSARSVPGVSGYRTDNITSSYPGQNLQSKLSGLEEKLSTMDLNSSANWQ